MVQFTPKGPDAKQLAAGILASPVTAGISFRDYLGAQGPEAANMNSALERYRLGTGSTAQLNSTIPAMQDMLAADRSHADHFGADFDPVKQAALRRFGPGENDISSARDFHFHDGAAQTLATLPAKFDQLVKASGRGAPSMGR